MNINLPSKARAVLYSLVTVGSPVAIYLQTVGKIGEPEMGLWLGITAAVSLLARLNVTPDEQ